MQILQRFSQNIHSIINLNILLKTPMKDNFSFTGTKGLYLLRVEILHQEMYICVGCVDTYFNQLCLRH